MFKCFSIDTYDFVAKISVFGALGTAFCFLAAIEEEFPPKPAHFVFALNF
jgi:hypothetical protein